MGVITMTPEYVNTLVKTGDVVFFTESSNRFVKAFKKISRGDQYHVGIIVRLVFNGDDLPFLVEALPSGRRLTNLSSYQHIPMTILRFKHHPVDTRYIAHHLFGKLLDGVGFVDYSFIGFLCMLLYEKTGIKLNRYKGETCAEMVAKIFEFQETQIFPATLYNLLLTKGFHVIR
jgi:hypothetical protein